MEGKKEMKHIATKWPKEKQQQTHTRSKWDHWIIAPIRLSTIFQTSLQPKKKRRWKQAQGERRRWREREKERRGKKGKQLADKNKQKKTNDPWVQKKFHPILDKYCLWSLVTLQTWNHNERIFLNRKSRYEMKDEVRERRPLGSWGQRL